MASARKKQDEKNLKTLRELGALPQNKYCFDCHQRGPTYVDVTIGSFVCTKCSGMLRGLTPPHRVKSISMATFTNEEIDLLKTRGNDYCKKTWLGLYDRTPPNEEIRDEQVIRDFMVDKYEKKRYYLDPAQALKNGLIKSLPINNNNNSNNNNKFNSYNNINNENKLKSQSVLVSDQKLLQNGDSTIIELRKRPDVNKLNNGFAVNFDNADIFSFNNNNNNNATSAINQQEDFANFDNNPVFNITTTNGIEDEFSIFDLKFTNISGPMLNQVPLFPKCNTHNNSVNMSNRWSTPTPLTLVENMQNQMKTHAAFPEDRYAALKDLDNALKSQNTVDWQSSSGSNGSLYSSPTPNGSMYNVYSSSPQSSMFGSPSQGQFMNFFQSQANHDNNISNPFNNSGIINWTTTTPITSTTTTQQQQSAFNPFRDVGKNGLNQNFQSTLPLSSNCQWNPNPFKVSGNGGLSSTNNPFL